MKTSMIFKRYELKYMLSKEQYSELKIKMASHMQLDEYGKHQIHNIYFDTPDYLLIRRSIEKPCYKEKLRVRCYGDYTDKSTVFIEMKKKYQGIVYKRRLKLAGDEAFKFLLHNKTLEKTSQISKEIQYFLKHYGNLQPKISLHYEREAYFGIQNHDFRMTFDQKICMEQKEVSLVQSYEGGAVIPDECVLLEVKTAIGLPEWLLEFFREHHIYKTSFSKYGKGYEKYVLNQPKGGSIDVA